MSDLVGTCPKDFWWEWIAEGDAAGDPETGEEWGWHTSHPSAPLGKPGDRFYVVAHGCLRGYAHITRVENNGRGGYVICRKGGAVAITLPANPPMDARAGVVVPEPIQGFRGLRQRWWPREDEVPFPDWKTFGVCKTRRKP